MTAEHNHDRPPPLVVARVVDNHPRHVGDYSHVVTVQPSTLAWRDLLGDIATIIVRRTGGIGILGKLLRAGKPDRTDDDLLRFVSALNAPRWQITLTPLQAAELSYELDVASDAVELCTCGRAVDVPDGRGGECGQCIDRRDFRVIPGGA